MVELVQSGQSMADICASRKDSTSNVSQLARDVPYIEPIFYSAVYATPLLAKSAGFSSCPPALLPERRLETAKFLSEVLTRVNGRGALDVLLQMSVWASILVGQLTSSAHTVAFAALDLAFTRTMGAKQREQGSRTSPDPTGPTATAVDVDDVIKPAGNDDDKSVSWFLQSFCNPSQWPETQLIFIADTLRNATTSSSLADDPTALSALTALYEPLFAASSDAKSTLVALDIHVYLWQLSLMRTRDELVRSKALGCLARLIYGLGRDHEALHYLEHAVLAGDGGTYASWCDEQPLAGSAFLFFANLLHSRPAVLDKIKTAGIGGSMLKTLRRIPDVDTAKTAATFGNVYLNALREQQREGSTKVVMEMADAVVVGLTLTPSLTLAQRNDASLRLVEKLLRCVNSILAFNLSPATTLISTRAKPIIMQYTAIDRCGVASAAKMVLDYLAFGKASVGGRSASASDGNGGSARVNVAPTPVSARAPDTARQGVPEASVGNSDEFCRNVDAVTALVKKRLIWLRASPIASKIIDVYPARTVIVDNDGQARPSHAYHVRVYVNDVKAAVGWPTHICDHLESGQMVFVPLEVTAPEVPNFGGSMVEALLKLGPEEFQKLYLPPIPADMAELGSRFLDAYQARFLQMPGVTAVTYDSVRHTRKGPVAGPCLVAYVRTKGILPWSSELLPKTVKLIWRPTITWPVDVREGTFSFTSGCVPTAQEVDRAGLCLGYSIGDGIHRDHPDHKPSTFTLGAFVRRNGPAGQLGFLTCAHGIYDHPGEEIDIVCPSVEDAKLRGGVTRTVGTVKRSSVILETTTLGGLDVAYVGIADTVKFDAKSMFPAKVLRDDDARLWLGLDTLPDWTAEATGNISLVGLVNIPSHAMQPIGFKIGDSNKVTEDAAERAGLSTSMRCFTLGRTSGLSYGTVRGTQRVAVAGEKRSWLSVDYKSEAAKGVILISMLGLISTGYPYPFVKGDSGGFCFVHATSYDDRVAAVDVLALGLIVGNVYGHMYVICPLSRALEAVKAGLVLSDGSTCYV